MTLLSSEATIAFRPGNGMPQTGAEFPLANRRDGRRWPPSLRGLRAAFARLVARIAPRLGLRTLVEEDVSGPEMQLRVHQVLNLAKQTPIHAAGNLFNAALTGWVFWDRLPHGAIMSWLAVFGLFTAIQLRRWWQRRHWPTPQRVSRRALVKATRWALLAGSLWGGAVIFAFPPESLALQLFLAFVVGGVSAGAVTSMSMQPIACLAYIVPALAPFPVLFAREPGIVATAVAIMTVLYLALLIAILVNGYKSFAETVQTKTENVSLATGLAEAALANRAKSDFLANMSHELRTPLNAILGFSEIISSELLGPIGLSKYRDYGADIHSSGQHLLRIINDVLDMSKIEVGKLELREGTVDVGLAVRASLGLVTQRAAAAGVTLATDLPSELPLIRADEVRVKQILLNLLSNAVKFTHRLGRATVGGMLRPDGSLALWVSDTGIGMSETEVSLAMEPFRQVDSDLARKYEGTGLGLPLTRALIELHGGRLELASARGIGTTATVVFPPSRVLPRAGADAATG